MKKVELRQAIVHKTDGTKISMDCLTENREKEQIFIIPEENDYNNAIRIILGPCKKVSCMGKICIPERMIRSGAYDGKMIKTDDIPDQYVIMLDFGDNKMAMIDTGFSEREKNTPYLRIF